MIERIDTPAERREALRRLRADQTMSEREQLATMHALAEYEQRQDREREAS